MPSLHDAKTQKNIINTETVFYTGRSYFGALFYPGPYHFRHNFEHISGFKSLGTSINMSMVKIFLGLLPVFQLLKRSHVLKPEI
jgi:hypothetical protein